MIKKFAILLVFLAASFSMHSQDRPKLGLTSELDSLSYSLGLIIGNNLQVQGVKSLNTEIYKVGLEDGFKSNPRSMTFEEANFYIQNYFEKQNMMAAEDNLTEGKRFLEQNAEKEGVVVLNSGLQYKVLQAGEGRSPKRTDQVKVHYKGSLLDGTVFDSSYDRGKPAVFGVSQVIKGWTEALMLMSPGSKWTLYIPPDLAYGSSGAGDAIGPNATLIFEVELLEVFGDE
jgi:FKBP-type peptidyl-prolyl cis-trans isomerase